MEAIIIENQQIISPSILDKLFEQAEESGFTIFHCTYITSPKYPYGWWVNIWPSTFLMCSGESLQLLNAINVPLAPHRHYLKSFGDALRFTLIFPQVPQDWAHFDFVEKCGSGEGFVMSSIKRNDSGVYRVRLI